MKIGIIAPSPIPFQMGGAERLWTQLRRYVNESDIGAAEVVKLPTSEATFWSTINGYEQFSKLDVSGFDLVITGKNPAWMVEHPNHYVYMLHPSRGLYEFYQGPEHLSDAESAQPSILRLWQTLEKRRGDPSFVPALFDALRDCERSPEIQSAVAWPGPFARRVIRFLDEIALSTTRVRKFSAISHTVASRPGYFPESLAVSVAYPPPVSRKLPPTARADFANGKTDRTAIVRPFFFTASRLDSNKRVALIAQAVSQLEVECDLLIAGEGDEFASLQQLARQGTRIRLLGRVAEAELRQLYNDCVAVVFVPYNEDYGLIAIEALAAGKALITCNDSGGVAEINLHERTGLTVAPTATAISDAMTRLLTHPAERRKMEVMAPLRAADANWPNVLNTITGNVHPVSGKRGAKRLVIALTWSFFPATSGGQVRIYHLYKNLAKWFDIAIVCLVPHTETYTDHEVATGLREIRVPKSKLHHQKDQTAEKELGVPVYDITAGLYIDDSPDFRAVLARECEGAHAVIASHPYFAPLLREVFAGPLWYEAHNVEHDLKAQLLPSDRKLTTSFLAFTANAEKLACDAAEQIWVCSETDSKRLVSLYPAAANKVTTVPNGTDVASFRFYTPRERLERRQQLLQNTGTQFALFLGSGHGPNIDAVREIMEVAPSTPDTVYWIVGSVCYAFDPRQKAPNIWFLGELSETERRIVMELATVALNPLTKGSGSSIKMFDYMACGLPIISTAVGARGLGLEDGVNYFVCENNKLGAFLRRFEPLEPSVEAVAKSARKHVEIHGDWANIARNLMVQQSESKSPDVAKPAISTNR